MQDRESSPNDVIIYLSIKRANAFLWLAQLFSKRREVPGRHSETGCSGSSDCLASAAGCD
jgi:hypothetical protein